MSLDLTNLEKVVTSFERVLKVVNDKARMAELDSDQQEAIRAGVIQNFELTYELSWKFIQRWLKENHPEDVELLRTRRDMFRHAAKQGLIEKSETWFEYGDARNMTAHTYSDDKARIVFETALKFLPDVQYLLKQLKERND